VLPGWLDPEGNEADPSAMEEQLACPGFCRKVKPQVAGSHQKTNLSKANPSS
jgi:hypothetical protein